MTSNHASNRQCPLTALAIIALLAMTTALFTGQAAAQSQDGVIPELTLGSESPGELTISWDAPESNDSTLSDYRAAWTPQDENYVSWRNPNEEHRGNAYPTGTALTLTGLKQDTGYRVMIRARYNRNDEGQRWSGPWHEGTVRVAGQPAPEPTREPDADGAIQGLSLAGSEPGQLVIIWETPEPAPTDYRIGWAQANLDFLSYTDADEAERANVYPDGDVNTLTLNDLTPGEEYKVHIRSRYHDGEHSDSPWSGPWTETATQRVKDHPPAAPTGLTASQVSHNSLTLSWDVPQHTGITGYRILRGDDAASLSSMETDTGNNSTEYTDATVEPETTYHYVVLALSPDGDGDQSGTVIATTPAAPQPAEQPVQNDPPEAPTGLTASSIEHDSLTLAWDDPQDDSITGYQVLRGAGEDTLSTLEPDTGNAGTEYTDSTLAAETTYFYAVTALSADGDSAQSGAMSVTIPAAPQPGEEPVQNDPPEAPTGLAASETSHDSLTLTWNGPRDDSVTGYRILRGTAPKNLPTIKEDTKARVQNTPTKASARRPHTSTRPSR